MTDEAPSNGEFRDFDAEYDLESKPGIPFKLGGQMFTTKGYPPVAAYRRKSRGLDAAVDFMHAVLVPEDVERFDALIDDPAAVVSGPQIDAVALWLMQEYSGRPTESPDSSGSTGDDPESEKLSRVVSS